MAKCFAQGWTLAPTVFLSEDSWIGIDTDGFAKKGGVLMWFNEIETIHDIIAPSNVIAAD